MRGNGGQAGEREFKVCAQELFWAEPTTIIWGERFRVSRARTEAAEPGVILRAGTVKQPKHQADSYFLEGP